MEVRWMGTFGRSLLRHCFRLYGSIRRVVTLVASMNMRSAPSSLIILARPREKSETLSCWKMMLSFSRLPRFPSASPLFQSSSPKSSFLSLFLGGNVSQIRSHRWRVAALNWNHRTLTVSASSAEGKEPFLLRPLGAFYGFHAFRIERVQREQGKVK